LLLGETDSVWISIPFYSNEVSVQYTVNFLVTRVLIDPELDIISKGNFSIQKSSFTDLTVYPNPASNTLYIIPQGDFKTVNAYSIFAIDGRLVSQTEGLRLSNTFHIDVQNLAQGAYHIQLVSGSNKRTERFIISR
jgi:hypothetical protein